MAEQPDPAAHGPRVAAQVLAQHDRLAPHDGDEPRAGAQQRRLACTVRTAEEDDLAPRHIQVDPGERRESSEQRNGSAEVDDRHHEPPRGY